MKDSDWEAVGSIYQSSITCGDATFRRVLPTFEEWDASHLKVCRFVAENSGTVVGWAALTGTSGIPAFHGVAELSIYIAEGCRGKGIGRRLLEKLIEESEKNGLWTLQANIFEENSVSIELHKKCGFRVIGVRERVAQDKDGKWRTNVLMEKRSSVVGAN